MLHAYFKFKWRLSRPLKYLGSSHIGHVFEEDTFIAKENSSSYGIIVKP